MRYDPERHNRRSVRLKGHQYAQAGAYYVTIVTHERAHLFGEVVDGQMQLSELGQLVQGEWLRSEQVRPEVRLDEFVVMPNHLHGIVWITDDDLVANVGAHGRAPLPPPTSPNRYHAPIRRAPRSLGSFVAGFKSIATTRINQMRGSPGAPVWQRNYYEHIIRDESTLNRIQEYIRANPERWSCDRENSVATSGSEDGFPWSD